MEILTEPAKKYVDSDIKFKLKLPSYQTRNVTGTFIDETNTIEDGKTLLTYKGNTSQEGTPTPSSPINVDVVSGYNQINVSNKNLFKETDYTNLTLNANGSATNITTTQNNFSFTTSTSSGFSGVYFTTTRIQDLISGFDATKNYVVSFDVEVDATARMQYGSTTKSIADITANEKQRLSVETLITGALVFYNLNRTVINFTISNIQIELNSQPTTYIQHQEQSYEVNLGKNLFDKDNATNGFFTANTGVLTSGDANWKYQYIKVSPNTTYTISGITTTQYTIGASQFDKNKSFVAIAKAYINGSFTTDANTEYVGVSVRVAETNAFQIEKGTQTTSYAPYFTPIELCKIGDYQDKIYRQNGNWYLHKEVGKVVLNGTENWTFYNSNSNRAVFYTTISNMERHSSSTDVFNVLSNRFIPATQSATWVVGNISYRYHENNYLYIIVDPSINTTDILKTWLGNNNTTINYALNTPTTTEITNQALISQLEEIWENLKTYQGETIISQTNSDLPFVLDILMEV